MSRRNLAWLLGVLSVAALGLTVSYSAPPQERDKDYELVRLVVDVLGEVDHKYVHDLDPARKRKLVEDMINGGLEQLDPHSQFINPEEYRQFSRNSRGKFGGVGIQISSDRVKGAGLVVISPMVGTPAYDAGVLAGDLILKIDGKTTENLRMSEAIDLIQGEPGSKVVLTVLHEGEKQPKDIEIVRAEIEIHSVMGDLRKADDPTQWDFMMDKTNKIAYVRLVAFNETAATELRKTLEELKQEGMRGLVLDLRNNPGGLLRGAVEISNFFISEGRIVSTKGRNHHEETYDASPGRCYLPDRTVPVVVLVNRYSASASEILAAALQDHNRAIIVGERSYGKGSVQNVIEMENHSSALKLTTASYWRPSGKNIHRFPDSKEEDEWGVKPNDGYTVELNDEERIRYLVYRRDRDIVQGKPGMAPKHEPAKEEKKDKSDDAEAPKDKKEEAPFVDRVLEKGLEYLRGELKKSNAALLPPPVHQG